MPEDSGQERTEEATPRRRQQARKKGTVAKSQDLTSSLVMIILIAILPSLISNLGNAFLTSVQTAYHAIPAESNFGTIVNYCVTVGTPSFLAFLPLVGLAMVIGVGANLAQVGFVISSEAIQPRLDKLNPLNGLKRLMSKDSIFETIKATAKTGLFSLIAYKTISANWPLILGLSWRNPCASIAAIGSLSYAVFIRIAATWLVLAAVDYFYQKKRVDKNLMMTKEELKQEYKEMETSPELKAAMARQRRRLAKQRSLAAVKNASVVITNPTHFAVAIQYERDKMHAPMVVAKGQDLVAFKIRELAKKNNVPIVPNPPLARQLYKKCEVGEFVPRELFQAVAEVLAYVFKTIQKLYR